MKRRNTILVLLVVFLGLCCLLSVIGGLVYFFRPQAGKPTPIIIVATLTPTPLPEGSVQEPTPTATLTPTPLPEVSVQSPMPTAATSPAPATLSPSTPGGDKVIGDIDADMKAHLQSIMATGQAKGRRINVFAKVGDSITESMAFLFDLGYGWEDLGEYTYLAEVVEYYRATTVDTMDGEAHNSFNRQSLCGVAGTCAGAPLESGPNSTLYQEIEAINPGVAIVMFGTNDVVLSDVDTFRTELGRIVSVCEEEGIIPILSTIPDRLDSPEAGALVPKFNAAIRDLARERNIPLIDYWLALQPLPNKGLDKDGIHPNAYFDGEYYGACDFTRESLQYGMNVRNKTFLEMLLKLKRVVIDDGPPDAGASAGAVPPTEPPVVSTVEPTATSMPSVTGAVRAFPDTRDGVYVFNDQLSGGTMTEEQFRFAATHYVGCQKMTRDDTRHLRQYNPGFILLHYRLGLGLGYQAPDDACWPNGNWLGIVKGNEWVQEWPGDEAVAESWFFPWAGQPRVYNCDWGWYLVELNDPGWRAWWSDQVMAQMAANEADGLFADSFSVPNYLGAGRYNPPLPEVDAAFEEAWARRIQDFTAYLQGRFGEYYFIPNVGGWLVTRDPTDYSGADGVMFEGFAEWEPHSPFELADWQLQMNRILDLTRRDKVVIAQSYLWDPNDVETRLFYLGNYLLVKGRHSYLNIEYSMEPEYFPEYGIELGPPLDELPAGIDGYFNTGWGVYSRRYAQGLVLVNPAPDTRSIDLGGTYYLAQPGGGGIVPADGDISAWSVQYTPVNRIELGPNQAAILLNAVPGAHRSPDDLTASIVRRAPTTFRRR